jgi:Protein of unknown function (DUF3617)
MTRLLLVLLLASAPARADITAGNWEISATTTVEGLGQPSSFSQTRCLTEEDARDPSRLFAGTPGGRCNFTSRNDTGSVFSFQVSCGTNPPVLGEGSVRYDAATLEGDVELTMEGLKTQSHITGRRLGPC